MGSADTLGPEGVCYVAAGEASYTAASCTSTLTSTATTTTPPPPPSQRFSVWGCCSQFYIIVWCTHSQKKTLQKIMIIV